MKYRGIDISEFQGKIDFNKVKAAGIECIIVRYADPFHDNYEDIYFKRNMQECQRLGFHFGAYIFSRATNAAAARNEAKNIIKACAKYKYDMPLYIDMESAQVVNVANEVIAAYLDECDKAGVIGGVYANTNWFTNYIDTEKIKERPLWIAQYYDRITHAHPEYFGIWQFTASGTTPGISGNTDLDNVYVEYWNQDKPEPEPIADDIKIKAVDVILDKYGTGEARKKALGKDYEKVQELVNEIIERLEE